MAGYPRGYSSLWYHEVCIAQFPALRIVEMQFSLATIDDLAEILALEEASFPPDEAATRESLTLRLQEAGPFFYKLANTEERGKIVGFVNGTLIRGPDLHEESMTTHASDGRILVIHSVTVNEADRRKYLGLHMLHKYISYMKKIPEVKEIRLLTKPYMMSLYLKAGFSLLGEWQGTHGIDRWWEMMFDTAVVKQLVVDAFTPVPFKGNPAAVVFEHRPDTWMQLLANENNLAETAFVSPLSGDKSLVLDSGLYPCDCYSLRWFTPTREVELCGHATLAAAEALYSTKRVSENKRIAFETVYSGILYAKKIGDLIQLDFPSTPPTAVHLTQQEIEYVCQSFGIIEDDVLYAGRSAYDLVLEITQDTFQKVIL